jgi:hypothetical protein
MHLLGMGMYVVEGLHNQVVGHLVEHSVSPTSEFFSTVACGNGDL